jgi:hypothetical protein
MVLVRLFAAIEPLLVVGGFVVIFERIVAVEASLFFTLQLTFAANPLEVALTF